MIDLGTGISLSADPKRQCMSLSLKAPRANALEPELLDSIRRALDKVESGAPDTLLLTAGANFCSGGDVAKFHDALRAGTARSYATTVVGALQECLLRLLSLPSTVVVAGRGAITGGGAGFLFAADLAVLSPDCFVQPYYGRMGFAPDGGWTAILPRLIGMAKAQTWLLADMRASASDMVNMGLATLVHEDPETEALALIQATDAATRRAAKRLIYTPEKIESIRTGLDAEFEQFCVLLERDETLKRMDNFLADVRS